MSTITNPEEKKQFSLERDRRNSYGENRKSSRKSIQRGKERLHMDEGRLLTRCLVASGRTFKKMTQPMPNS